MPVRVDLPREPCDVVVCGGGPAGWAAAVAAARRGVATTLVERTSWLGGMAGGARVTSFCDSPGGPLFDELLQRLIDLDAAELRVDPERFRPPGRYRFEPETCKAVMLEMALEAGVAIRFETFAFAAVTDALRVGGVRLASKAGETILTAPVVVDATADADVAASAGAACEHGDPDDGRLQHCNFRWTLAGVDWIRFRAALPVAELLTRLRRAHREGRLSAPSAIFGLDQETFPWDGADGKLQLGNWELQHVDPSLPSQTSAALAECQLAALRWVRFARRELPGFESCRIGAFATALGTRESRRIVGRYRVTREDVLAGRKHPDAIARAWFWMDLHDPPPGRSIPYALEYVKSQQPPPGDWYEIPYRSLLPEQVEGLLVAGRCLSCDRDALGSLRVMPTCIATGVGAGTAAALAVSAGCAPHGLDGAAVSDAVLTPSGAGSA